MGTCEGRDGCCVRLDLYVPKRLYTPQGAETVSGMIYESDKQGVIKAQGAQVWWICVLFKYTLLLLKACSH